MFTNYVKADPATVPSVIPGYSYIVQHEINSPGRNACVIPGLIRSSYCYIICNSTVRK